MTNGWKEQHMEDSLRIDRPKSGTTGESLEFMCV